MMNPDMIQNEIRSLDSDVEHEILGDRATAGYIIKTDLKRLRLKVMLLVSVMRGGR